MHVAALALYPVKGCHRVEVERSVVQPWGLAGDRRWAIVDARTGVALTQRDTTVLTRVQPTPAADGIVLSMPGRPDLEVPHPSGAPLIEVMVSTFTGPAMPAGAAADAWLSQALDRDVRLVWLDDPTRRRLDPNDAANPDRVNLADVFPVSLGNLASLAALNDWILDADPLAAAVPITRFRPNIVITGAPAWVEDSWNGARLRIGEVVFRVAAPIDRCVVTTIDQESGEKGREPLRTLGRHRNIDQGLMFCTSLVPDSEGTIAVGDPVTPL